MIRLVISADPKTKKVRKLPLSLKTKVVRIYTSGADEDDDEHKDDDEDDDEHKDDDEVDNEDNDANDENNGDDSGDEVDNDEDKDDEEDTKNEGDNEKKDDEKKHDDEDNDDDDSGDDHGNDNKLDYDSESPILGDTMLIPDRSPTPNPPPQKDNPSRDPSQSMPPPRQREAVANQARDDNMDASLRDENLGASPQAQPFIFEHRSALRKPMRPYPDQEPTIEYLSPEHIMHQVLNALVNAELIHQQYLVHREKDSRNIADLSVKEDHLMQTANLLEGDVLTPSDMVDVITAEVLGIENHPPYGFDFRVA
ncbi:PREDICTED: acidic repeat-containing protein-like [Ipomoea nil]|uniref:acidic repeat-containing protein-like n=1 Tax=Ipomoea nil TaxID=35883 RepID=UPI000901B3DA|nr:PREDICTED: acidic repeat-containing protein-like [Ipomoea nil]